MSRWLVKGGSEGGLMAVAGWTRPDMLLRYTRAQASAGAAERGPQGSTQETCEGAARVHMVIGRDRDPSSPLSPGDEAEVYPVLESIDEFRAEVEADLRWGRSPVPVRAILGRQGPGLTMPRGPRS